MEEVNITNRKCPPPREQPRSATAETILALKVGQCAEVLDYGRRVLWSTTARYWGRKLGRRYTTRKLPGGFGLWRVE